MLSLFPRAFKALGILHPRIASLALLKSRIITTRYLIPFHNFTTKTSLRQKFDDQLKSSQAAEASSKAAAEASSKAANEVSKTSQEIYTIPNILTMTRIASTPFIGAFIVSGHLTAAISVFLYSCLTDFIDGFLARRYNMKSVLGSILDPAADKFLMTVCTGALAWQGTMPLYAAGAIFGRDLLLSLLAFRIRYMSLPPPKTLYRFFDMSITTHTVHPNWLGKVNTALQMIYIGGLVLVPGLEQIAGAHDILHDVFHYFGIVVTATTVLSGLSYLSSKNAAKIVHATK